MTRPKKMPLLEKALRAEQRGRGAQFAYKLSPRARRAYARQYSKMFQRAILDMPSLLRGILDSLHDLIRAFREVGNAFDNYYYTNHENKEDRP